MGTFSGSVNTAKLLCALDAATRSEVHIAEDMHGDPPLMEARTAGEVRVAAGYGPMR